MTRRFIFDSHYEQSRTSLPSEPLHLFKYRGLRGEQRQFTKSLIINSEVYFARPDELNDPFDCKPHTTLESTEAERKAMIAWMVKGKEPDLPRAARRKRSAQIAADLKARIARDGFEKVSENAYATNLKDTGVLSLTEDPMSNLMWSHYGDSHRGVCVMIDFSEIIGLCPMPVRYSHERPSFNMFKKLLSLEDVSFLHKSEGWAYEREWRSVGLWWGGPFVLPPKAVTGVVLGAGISADDRREVLQWVATRGLVAMQAILASKTFDIELKPICG